MAQRERPPPAATSHYYGREPSRKDTVIPPWERAPTKRVPFVDANTASRKYCYPSPSEGSSPNEPHTKHWSTTAGQQQAAPYETHLGFPPIRRTNTSAAASRPDYYYYVPPAPVRITDGPAPPLTPPDSTRGRSIDHTNISYPRDEKNPSSYSTTTRIRVLPGTMATRPTTTTTITQHGSHHHHHHQQQQQQEEEEEDPNDEPLGAARKPETFGKRLKAALCSIFKKRVTNEEDYVTVGDKHWTEE
ncbi:hypothetical protein CERZMDRAFT_96181 [Cercospora zeae-maydis SCOH1-5]|uniref:Uncharacterized protein n=1 Tax=Cercospora zeae-maydis SCOH1-5 TaxID=717836 RepID=A0A6A6FL35_9PEZI|nr:hypothetical protein CERZMDRAFT_96181 [Cercospora zeae-maydis SCOH1-5]